MARLIRGFVLLLAAGVAAMFAVRFYQENQTEGDAPRPKGKAQDPPEPEPDSVDAEEVAEGEVTEDSAVEDAAAGERTPREGVAEVVTLKGVMFADPGRALAFANDASDEMLVASGLTANARKALLGGRPYGDLAALGGTKGIGKKTLETIRDA